MADLIAALVVAVFLVKQQRVGAAFRNTDAVIVAVYRGEVADEEKILFLCFIAADKAENTAVSVVGVDPLEAVILLVQAVERRIFVVERQKPFHIILEVGMERLFRKVPVEGDFFIPFMELTEILSHEEKFLARMSEHESVADFQVGKFILVFARHFVDHRAFEVDDLVVREHQNEVFAGAVGDAEGHFVVVKFTEIRVELHVFEEVMHPAHIPFEGKSKTVLLRALGNVRPGGGFLGNDDGAVLPATDHAV